MHAGGQGFDPPWLHQYSLIAQLVEHSTVNRVVTGSSPVRGALWRGVRVGRRSTIGNRVGAKSVSRVRIPLSPPALIIDMWPVGQGVKTPPFHGGNRGSNPLRVIVVWRLSSAGRASALQAEGRGFDPLSLHH